MDADEAKRSSRWRLFDLPLDWIDPPPPETCVAVINHRLTPARKLQHALRYASGKMGTRPSHVRVAGGADFPHYAMTPTTFAGLEVVADTRIPVGVFCFRNKK